MLEAESSARISHIAVCEQAAARLLQAGPEKESPMPARTTAKKPNSRRKNPRAALSRYHARRDFSQSPEPTGKEHRLRRAATHRPLKLAYCVQKHLASHLHYDFRLESPGTGTLLSWAVPKGPSLRPKDKRLAMRVEDHPNDYRNFEGVIPSGYGAGVVMLWDIGSWSPEPGFDDVGKALARGELKFRLEGVKLKGSWVLVRTGAATPTGERETWLLIKHRDSWAGDVDVAAAAPRSVKSDRTFEQILKADPELWESHAEGGSSLQKIAEKVAALEEPKKLQRRSRGKK